MSLPLSTCQDVCYARWYSDKRLAFAFLPILTIMLVLFIFFTSFFSCIPCTKCHKLVWNVYRWRNFVRMQHYFSHSSLFGCVNDVSYHMCRDTLPLWPKAEFVTLTDAMTKSIISLSDITCKKGLGIRGLILWS